MLIALSLGVTSHIIILSPLMREGQRDAWIGVLMAAACCLAIVPLIYFVMKKTGNQNLYFWIRDRYGKGIALLLVVPAVLQIWFVCVVVLKESVNWAKSVYLPLTPPFFIALLYLTFAFIAAKSGLRTIALTAGALLPLLIVMNLFVVAANVPNAEFSYLTPVLEHGLRPAANAGLMALSTLSEISVVLLLQHYIRAPLKQWPLWANAAYLVFFMLALTIQAIATFGPTEASKQLYTLYEEWRLVRIDKFFERTDIWSVFQWYIGTMLRLSTFMFIVGQLLSAGQERRRSKVLAIVCTSTLVPALLPVSDHTWRQLLMRYYMPVSVTLWIGLLILLAILVGLRARNGVERSV